MDNPAEETASPPDHKTFNEILRALAGHVVTVVNPESYEAGPVGYQIKAGFYKAKVLGVADDYITVVSEFTPHGKGAKKEPVKQFIPLCGIKRVSVMKADRLIHL